MITPEIIQSLIASGRSFELTADGGLIVDPAPQPDTRSRKARNQAAYRQRQQTVTSGNATVTDGNKRQRSVTKPSPSPLSPTPPIPTPPPAPPLPCVHEAGDFGLTAEVEPKPKRFMAPTQADWRAFAKTLDPPLPELEADNTWNHYQAKGWKVGNSPMKDWKAALRTCHGRWLQDGKHISPNRNATHRQSPQRSDTANRPGRYSGPANSP